MSSVYLCNYVDRKLMFSYTEKLTSAPSISSAILRISRWLESVDAELEPILSRTASKSVLELSRGRLHCLRPSLAMLVSLLTRLASHRIILDARKLYRSIRSPLHQSWSFLLRKHPQNSSLFFSLQDPFVPRLRVGMFDTRCFLSVSLLAFDH